MGDCVMFGHLDLADENIYKIIDLLNIHIYWKDTQSNFLGCNTNVLKAFNLKKRQDFIGKNDYDFLEKSEADKIIAIDQSVLQGTPYHDEEVVILTNGEVRTYVTTKNPILDDNGKIIGILGTSVDITDIKNKMEKEKQELIFNEEEKIRQIIDVVDASIYWKDREGRYLGCNKYVLKMAGITSLDEIIGKTDFDMVWKNEAPKLIEIDNSVMTTNQRYEGEELISIASSKGKPIVVLTVKNPLLNKNGNVVGIVGTSLDVTNKNEIEQLKLQAEKHKIYAEEQEKFRQIIDLIDASIYWKDKAGRFLGCNKYVLRMAGINSMDEIVGKTDLDMLWKNDTPKIREVDELVMNTNTRYEGEEVFLVANNSGKPIVVLTVKNPLLDNQGNVIGIVGASLDITAQKEAEQLQIEAQKHKIYAEEQEKFVKVVGQMAHDIRSPLSTLKTITQTASELGEQKRITLRRATMNVEDITNHMLNLYKPQESALTENNQRQYVLVSVILMEIASERRYKYQNSPIHFDLVINASQINNFVFIQIEPSNLRRMLSNLINNAVEALPKSGGKITLELNSNDEWVKIEVMDNGKGIPFETLYNLRQKIGVKTTKKTGFGIGLTQVFDVIESNYGRFEIDSGVGSGTTFAIRFPKAKAANWLASEINITPEDIIIIVDDDVSIHGAWDSRINYILEKFPTLQVKHFMEGNDALEFIHNLPAEKVKNNVYLLNDYELINEELNGLDIISKSGVKRAILVTSHYADTKVRKAASKMGTKILPKELAYCIPLKVQRPKYKPGELANVHMVFVDDDPEVVEQEIADHYSHLIIDVYHDPFEFLNDIDKYPKDTKIIMDNNYQSGGVLLPISGITLAETLHEKGYTKLYLYSWQQCDTPDYVVFILKTDREKMTQLDLL
ncbi:MAG: two-component system, OmpR family, aerobic respiration control sensor histidine kinase ArcB [Pseudomonadota bacterium]|nr:two-component system, OmpR family, aerobic respiration control sensor histidine kinase ArcB [Pseudomonadota bacterium]